MVIGFFGYKGIDFIIELGEEEIGVLLLLKCVLVDVVFSKGSICWEYCYILILRLLGSVV